MEFFLVPLGGAVIGYGLGRVAAMLFAPLRNHRLVLVSISLALAFASMVIAVQLGFSGFVAVVSAGITLAALGPPRSKPEAWRYLREVWEQLEFWASSMLFVLAAFMIPTLLEGLGISDLVAIMIVIVMALCARAGVVFGILPLLTAARLSPHVSLPYKSVIVWGGLRGAATLALALAVTEHPEITPEIKRFVAVVATGFVLFTLLVQGTTLRPLVRRLRLNHLTPLDSALHEHAIGVVADQVRGRLEHAATTLWTCRVRDIR
jgi:CPA1 family monovalent cation:H+ antiporter